MVLQKIDLGGSESISRTVMLVDRSSPDFFRRTREGLPSITFFPIFEILIRSEDRPRELEDLGVKQETTGNHKTAGNYRSGRPNNQ